VSIQVFCDHLADLVGNRSAQIVVALVGAWVLDGETSKLGLDISVLI
jgi:hypothetical protein